MLAILYYAKLYNTILNSLHYTIPYYSTLHYPMLYSFSTKNLALGGNTAGIEMELSSAALGSASNGGTSRGAAVRRKFRQEMREHKIAESGFGSQAPGM